MPEDQPVDPVRLLGPTDVRLLADRFGVRPTKQRGQNFVIDANTVRRIARLAGIGAGDTVLEVGSGLGSLTLALLERSPRVVAVEIDGALARALPATLADFAPTRGADVTVVHADALRVEAGQLIAVTGEAPTALVANLPYNVSVPVLLHLLEIAPTVRTVLVMVQAEVADRLAAAPGSRTYGVPSVKAAWYADLSPAGRVGRTVFWPVPNVDSGLVRMVRHDPPAGVARELVFAVVDAAFAQRRKMLRSALAGLAGSPAGAIEALATAGVSAQARGEQLAVTDFVAIARALRAADVSPRH
ncbi:MAG: 16S rRNA (adenine(1518)-N(6)/adenine(1519)-N(6))-dimethyltransferase RsmA [Actinomycetota bacterium]|nr:16S rRNA (adenine(1518)-N(6)/adenine(1519)-N(6))-dimethyltransferase RsmA [Actinomycetota bacterium]